jgi:predicted RNA polymerase sigma factor
VTDTHRTIDAAWKLESARIIAGLMRIVHDVGLAEEFAQDALVAALRQWPVEGVPGNPGAWLTAIAKRRAVDHIRRARLHERRAEAYARELDQPPEPESDDVLRLMFISCHPVPATESRVALTLRVVGGLTTREIARASSGAPRAVTASRRSAGRSSTGSGRARTCRCGSEPCGGCCTNRRPGSGSCCP